MVEPSGERASQLRPPLRDRLTQAQWLGVDAAVAGLAFAACVLKADLPRAAASGPVPGGLAAVILVALGTLPAAARRRVPVAALGVMAVASAVLTGLGRSPLALDVTVGLGAYTVAARCERRTAVIMFAVVEAVLGTGAVVAVARDVAGSYVIHTVLAAGALWFAGDSARYRRQYAAAAAAEEARRRQEDREQYRRAVQEERVRVARELHDVVAHSLTVMTVQAGVARRVVQRPEEASSVLESIETTGLTAQGELRLILGLLRDDERDGPDLAPAPGLGDLPALVADVRAAGLPVELRVLGTSRPVSPALALCLFRIVQEALTNVVKHASQARTTVELSYGNSDIRVEIVNDGPRDVTGIRMKAAQPAGPGHGILGMRERVGAFGGILAAGPAAGAGFRIAASVPLRNDP